jgi:hypothetical protein
MHFLFVENTGLEKQYTFRQCLFEADISCGSASASAHAEALVYGSLNTTMYGPWRLPYYKA